MPILILVDISLFAFGMVADRQSDTAVCKDRRPVTGVAGEEHVRRQRHIGSGHHIGFSLRGSLHFQRQNCRGCLMEPNRTVIHQIQTVGAVKLHIAVCFHQGLRIQHTVAQRTVDDAYNRSTVHQQRVIAIPAAEKLDVIQYQGTRILVHTDNGTKGAVLNGQFAVGIDAFHVAEIQRLAVQI